MRRQRSTRVRLPSLESTCLKQIKRLVLETHLFLGRNNIFAVPGGKNKGGPGEPARAPPAPRLFSSLRRLLRFPRGPQVWS